MKGSFLKGSCCGFAGWESKADSKKVTGDLMEAPSWCSARFLGRLSPFIYNSHRKECSKGSFIKSASFLKRALLLSTTMLQRPPQVFNVVYTQVIFNHRFWMMYIHDSTSFLSHMPTQNHKHRRKQLMAVSTCTSHLLYTESSPI